MIVSQFFLFALSTFACKPKNQHEALLVAQNEVCSMNVNNTYFVVSYPPPPVVADKSANQMNSGYKFADAQAACESLNLRLANLTRSQLPEIWNMCNYCGGASQGYWMDIYESLTPPYGCWSFWAGNQVMSVEDICMNYTMFAICQVPDDVVVSFPTVTITTLQATSTLTSTSTFYTTETALITDYEFFTITSTNTEGTYAVTCTTSTRTIISTITNLIPCHRHHPDSSSSSSWWNKCGRPQAQTQKILRDATSPDIFVACTVNSNYELFLVENRDPGTNATSQDACDAVGYNVANMTEPILPELTNMFTGCSVSRASAGFWYAYQPLGCLLMFPSGVLFIETNEGLTFEENCLDQQWVFCRAGPAVISTSTVQTNSFTTLVPTATNTITETSLSIVSQSESTTSTITETSTETTITFTDVTQSTLTTTNSTKTLTKTKTRCTTTTKCQHC